MTWWRSTFVASPICYLAFSLMHQCRTHTVAYSCVGKTPIPAFQVSPAPPPPLLLFKQTAVGVCRVPRGIPDRSHLKGPRCSVCRYRSRGARKGMSASRTWL
ncbi:hypothetical protein HOY82DRAFT_101231 [Tuber indicum]|nr:hypothetical protein HOY82DRAFT_101231 [Tuber indicum]